MTEPAVVAHDVCRWFDTDGERVRVLKGVTFALERGEFATIMGPSGSGKSTLLHILAGLDTPSTGTVTI